MINSRSEITIQIRDIKVIGCDRILNNQMKIFTIIKLDMLQYHSFMKL